MDINCADNSLPILPDTSILALPQLEILMFETSIKKRNVYFSTWGWEHCWQEHFGTSLSTVNLNLLKVAFTLCTLFKHCRIFIVGNIYSHGLSIQVLYTTHLLRSICLIIEVETRHRSDKIFVRQAISLANRQTKTSHKAMFYSTCRFIKRIKTLTKIIK